MSNEINKQVELYALVAEMEAMKAENAYRECVGQVVAYGEDAFCEIADKMRTLIDKPVEVVEKQVKTYAEDFLIHFPKAKLSMLQWCDLYGADECTAEDGCDCDECPMWNERMEGEK